MKKSLLMFALLFCYSLVAQIEMGIETNNSDTFIQERVLGCGIPTPGNLVINGDFEQYSLLPSSSGQIVRACNWGSVYFPSSPDYFHRNATPGPIYPGIPLNFVGNQEVNANHGGDAYAGILYYVTDPVTFNYREIIRTQLDEPLVANTDYQLTFDVSLADMFLDNPIKLQAYLGSFHDFSTGDEFPLGGNNILLSNTEFSTNSDGWDTITFCFTTGATAGQEYLYLGGISNTENIPGGAIQRAHYYIDNVDLSSTNACGAITVTKEAFFEENDNAATDVVYVGRPFEWRVTIENTIPNYEFTFQDIFPFGTNQGDCGFSILNDVMFTGATTGDINDLTLAGTIILNVGTTIISFEVRPCTDSSFSGTIYENCFNYINPDGEWESVCDEVLLAYGCPAALSDGFCLFPEDMEQGDTITSDLIFHVNFSGINKMEGQLIFDPTVFDSSVFDPTNLSTVFQFDPVVTVNTLMSSAVQTVPGVIDFTFVTNVFNIGSGSGNTYVPFSVNLILLEDLDGCTAIYINNLIITDDGSTGPSQNYPIFVDPGEFCSEFDINYESAWIITQPGDNCDDGSIDLTVIGPFETQNPNTTYLWSPNGETTQTITVTENGTYSVIINDQNGCERFASYTVSDCLTTHCECGDLNPEIIYSIDGCYVTAYANVTSCNNLDEINYIWTFSNGTIYYGEFPPVQFFQDFQQGDNTIALKINYQLSHVIKPCSENVVENIYVVCDTLENDDNNNRLTLYPNPAQNQVIVSLETQDSFGGNIELVSMSGRVIQEAKFDTMEGERTYPFDVSKLETGVYFIRLIIDTGIIETKRIIIE